MKEKMPGPPEKSGQKLIENIKNFQGTLEEFLRFCGCAFIFSENSEKEKEFFDALLKYDIETDLLKAFIDKIIARERTALFGRENTGESAEECLTGDEIGAVCQAWLEKLIKHDAEQKVIKKILAVYPYYCLGDNQPLVFTGSLICLLEKHGKQIDKCAQADMVVRLRALMNINTDTFNLHEDDFWRMNEIIFNQNGADIYEYLKSEEKQAENDATLNFQIMNFCYECALESLARGGYLEEIQPYTDYLRKQAGSKKYFAGFGAKNYLSILESAIFSVEEQAFQCLSDYDAFEENGQTVDIDSIVNRWENLPLEEKVAWYDVIRRYPPQLSSQELEEVDYAAAVWPNGQFEFDDLLSAPLTPDLTGRYSAQGELRQAGGGEKTIYNEELIERFFRRQNEIGETDFIEQADENYLFFVFANLHTRKQIEEDLGANLGALNMYVQKQLFYFIKDLRLDEFKNLQNFLAKNEKLPDKLNRLKAFLSMEQDAGNGRRILEIGNRLESEKANHIFQKIAELTEIAEKETEELSELFYQDMAGENHGKALADAKVYLLEEAGRIINQFNEALAADELGEGEPVKKLLADLETKKTEISLLAGVLKSAKKNRETIDLEKIKNLKLERLATTALTPDDKQKIISLAENNSGPNSTAARSLKEALKGDKPQECYILKYKNEVIGFIRFHKTGDNTVYAGSLNIYQDLHGVCVGKYLMAETIREKAKEGLIVEAITSPERKANFHYNHIGFVFDGLIENYQNKGARLTMRMDERQPAAREEIEKIKAEYKADFGGKNIAYPKGQNRIILRADTTELEELLKTFLPKKQMGADEKIIATDEDKTDKYFISQLMPDEEDKNFIYLVFEKNKN